jgi:hypothetical protein
MDMLALPVRKPDLLQRISHREVSEHLAFQSATPLLALPEKPCSQRRETPAGC